MLLFSNLKKKKKKKKKKKNYIVKGKFYFKITPNICAEVSEEGNLGRKQSLKTVLPHFAKPTKLYVCTYLCG